MPPETKLTDDMLIAWGGAVKALGEGRVGGIGVRFTNADDRDLEGEYFTEKTYYGARNGDGADCWIDHGFQIIEGEQGKQWADHLLSPVKATKEESGLWVETLCDMADEYEAMVYEMVEAGKLGWSSATAGHMRRVTDDGEITRWPIVEFSLTPTPAEPRNRVMTLKAYKALSTEPPQADPPQGDVLQTPPATAATKSAEPPKPKVKRKGGKTTVDIRRIQIGSMHYAYKFALDEETEKAERVGDPLFASIKIEEVDTFIEDANMTPDARALAKVVAGFEKTMDNFAKAFTAQTGAKEPGLYAGSPATVKTGPTLADFIIAERVGDVQKLKNMGSVFSTWKEDGRFANYSDGTKVLGDQTGAAGGFTVPSPMSSDFIRIDPEQEIVWPTGDQIPVIGSTIPVPGLDTTGSTAGETNTLGGVVVRWNETGTTKPETEPEFTQIELKPYEISGYTEIKEALLQDSPLALASILTGLFRNALMYYTDESFLDGTGAGQPQGIITAPGTLVLARNTVLRILYEDLMNMYMHMMTQARSGAFWTINQMAMMEIMQITDPAGNYIWQPNARDGIPDTIFGRPVKWTEKTPTLGTQGDIIFMNPAWYYIGTKQGVTIASSEHFLFRSNRIAYRCVMRVDGQEKLPAPVFLKDGENQVSPFVVLGAPIT